MTGRPPTFTILTPKSSPEGGRLLSAGKLSSAGGPPPSSGSRLACPWHGRPPSSSLLPWASLGRAEPQTPCLTLGVFSKARREALWLLASEARQRPYAPGVGSARTLSGLPKAHAWVHFSGYASPFFPDQQPPVCQGLAPLSSPGLESRLPHVETWVSLPPLRGWSVK